MNLWEEELSIRIEQGSNESWEDWYSKLVSVTQNAGTFSVAIKEDGEYVGLGIVCEGLSLHVNNLATVFGMVAKEGYGTRLIREMLKASKAEGYGYLHVSIKEDLLTYKTKYIKLK